MTCCDMHGRNCEPPAELCCDRCTEIVHVMGDALTGRHIADGSICSNPDLSSLRGPYPLGNCYCGGPEEIYAHEYGTGYYCRHKAGL